MVGLTDWKLVQVGQRVSAVVNLVCGDLQGVGSCHLCQSVDRQAAKLWVRGSMPQGSTFCLLDVRVSAVNPVVLDLDGQSSVVPVPACRLSAVPKVVELCSGLGAFTGVLPRVSMTAAAGVAPCTSWG